MNDFVEPKRQYSKRSPEEVRAELESRLQKMDQKQKIQAAVGRPELQPLIEAKNELISEKNKNSVLLGNTSLGLNYKLRLTSAKLSMLQDRRALVSYVSENISRLVSEINAKISELALKDVINPEDVIVATSFQDEEYNRLLNAFENSESLYESVKNERMGKKAVSEEVAEGWTD
jgi:translation initiation factor 2B subunit (eIF-2B alpha/beta/delta family)